MKITCKTTLLAPDPPLAGTRIQIAVTDESPVWGIFAWSQADTSHPVEIDWGDDSNTASITGGQVTHTYARGGVYTVTIADNLTQLALSTNDPSSPYYEYAKAVRRFEAVSDKLTMILPYAFHNCQNMTDVDFSRTGATALLGTVFANCTSLKRRVDLPTVSNLVCIGDELTFTGCPQVEEIHFARANEAAIRATPVYLVDPTLGTGRAVCVFDL